MPGETPWAHNFSHKGKWEPSERSTSPAWWDIAPSSLLLPYRIQSSGGDQHGWIIWRGVGAGQKGRGHSNHCAELKNWPQILLTGLQTSPRGLPPNPMGHLTGSLPQLDGMCPQHSTCELPRWCMWAFTDSVWEPLQRASTNPCRQHTHIPSWLDLAGLRSTLNTSEHWPGGNNKANPQNGKSHTVYDKVYIQNL